MERLKFRVWDKNVPANTSEKELSNPTGMMIPWHYIKESTYLISAINGNYPIMQFIDREDSEGVDMYEGDIIRNNGFEYLIVWDDRTSAYRAKSISNGSLWTMNSANIGLALIVGNMYQNPNLLIC